MKRFILPIVVAAALVSGLLLNQARGDSDDVKPAAKAETKKEPEEPRVTRDTNGNAVIKIDDETQKLAALKIETVAAAQLAPELKAYGRVADPSTLSSLVNELAATQAAYAVSSNELQRLKTLSTTGNASSRAIQTAEAAAVHDDLAIQSVRQRLTSAWGRDIATQTNLSDFMPALTSADAVLIHADLPAGQRLSALPTAARVVAMSSNSIDADVLSAATSVDPLTQGQGFVLLVKTNAQRLLPGEAVVSYLKIPGEPLSGVMIPRSAIIRTEGRRWVYVVKDEDHFTRREIVTDQPMPDGWFLTNGIAAGEKIIVTGAQSVLSDELKPSGPPD